MLCTQPSQFPRGYHLGLELLASIPLKGRVKLADLARDFRLDVGCIKRALRRAEDEFGIPLLWDDRQVEIMPGGKTKVESLTTSYWAQVYEPDLH